MQQASLVMRSKHLLFNGEGTSAMSCKQMPMVLLGGAVLILLPRFLKTSQIQMFCLPVYSHLHHGHRAYLRASLPSLNAHPTLQRSPSFASVGFHGGILGNCRMSSGQALFCKGFTRYSVALHHQTLPNACGPFLPACNLCLRLVQSSGELILDIFCSTHHQCQSTYSNHQCLPS